MQLPPSTSQVRDKEIQYGWLKLLYLATVFGGALTGISILFLPDELCRKIIGIPYSLPIQDPVIYGVVGSFWLTSSIVAICGLRWPLRFLGMLVIQLVYKTVWFLCIFFPLLLTGRYPDYGWGVAIGNALYLALDIKAIPFHYLFRDDSSVEASAAAVQGLRIAQSDDASSSPPAKAA